MSCFANMWDDIPQSMCAPLQQAIYKAVSCLHNADPTTASCHDLPRTNSQLFPLGKHSGILQSNWYQRWLWGPCVIEDYMVTRIPVVMGAHTGRRGSMVTGDHMVVEIIWTQKAMETVGYAKPRRHIHGKRKNKEMNGKIQIHLSAHRPGFEKCWVHHSVK